MGCGQGRAGGQAVLSVGPGDKMAPATQRTSLGREMGKVAMEGRWLSVGEGGGRKPERKMDQLRRGQARGAAMPPRLPVSALACCWCSSLPVCSILFYLRFPFTGRSKKARFNALPTAGRHGWSLSKRVVGSRYCLHPPVFAECQCRRS